MKKVLIFGAVKHVIEKAKELGYETIVVDQNPNLKTIELADKFKCIPFENFEESSKFAKEEKVDGIVNATEFAVLVSSYVANNMNLPSIRYETACIAKNKYEIRRKMQKEGIVNVPQFFEVETIEQLNEIKNQIKFPVILKPCSGLGSLNVYRVEDLKTLEEKIYEVIHASFNNKALIETFISGQEYGVEAFVYKDEIHILAIMKKNMTELPYRSELGHIIPSGLPIEIENKIAQNIRRLIKALGIDCGAVNFDLILSEENDVYVVDVGARMGGNAITSHIIPLSKGIDHVGNVIKYAMNDDTINLEARDNKCIVTRILDLDEGTIKELPDFSKYLDNEVVEIFFEKSVGDKIEKYVSDAQRCGLIILKGDDVEKLKEKSIQIRNQINDDIIREK
ncbi:MAG: ATP-grasp domain-containing protein [Clostridia bacterium]|nr:ATP-grasp domain-containing protein [Clostridia bacterium]